MLKIINTYLKCCASGFLLHQTVRINQYLLPKRILHQTIPVCSADDDKSKNNSSSRKNSENQRIYKNNLRHMKYRLADKEQVKEKKPSKETVKNPTSVYDLFSGLKIDYRTGGKRRFNKQKVVTIENGKTKLLTGRDEYLREALAESQYNRKIMPKEDKYHLEPLRNSKLKKRQRDQARGVPHNAYFQVVGNGSPGGGKSLLLYTDINKYMFNCGEGSQRLAIEYCGHKTLSNMTDIFVTSKTWASLGGLPGMLLSIRSSGAPDTTIHGPPGVSELYETVKTFIVLHDFDVLFKTNSDTFEDQAIIVNNVSLKPFHDDEGQIDLTVKPSNPKHTLWLPDVIIGQAKTGEYLVNAAIESKLNDRQGFSNPRDLTVTAYVVDVKPKPGKLSIEKCVELGIPPGPLYGELKAGHEITLDSGRVVSPNEVLEDASPPSSFIVMECPSEQYLYSLRNSELLSAERKANSEDLQAIFHFTPSHVVASPGYKKWINSFRQTVQHIFLNDSNQGYGSHGIQGFNFRMNNLNPHLFPLLSTNDVVGAIDQNGTSNEKLKDPYKKLYCDINGKMLHGSLAQKIHVRPKPGLIEEYQGEIIKIKENEEELLNLPSGSQELIDLNKQEHTKMKLNSQLLPADSDYEYPKVTFLGTGSCVPSKYRNVSSILIENLPNKYIILDCGEGTTFQMHRMYGRDKTTEILRQLSAIYISHLHADHHLGLIRLLKEREQAFKEVEEPVKMMYLIAPSRISHFLCMYHANFEDILTDLCQIRNEHLLPFSLPNRNEPTNWTEKPNNSSPTRNGASSPFQDKNPYSNASINPSDEAITTQKIYPQILNPLLKNVGLKSIKTCRALHCPGAFCVSFVFNYEKDDREYKLVYTGDTRPTEQLVELASDADLLIHEATLEHYMLKDCEIKKHSTFTEAIDCSKQARAKFTIFTHFSQRYAKFPIFEEFEKEENIGWAWDFMSVCPKTFKYFKSFHSSVIERFPEELNEMLTRKEEFVSRDNKSKEQAIFDQLGMDADYSKNSKRKRKFSPKYEAIE